MKKKINYENFLFSSFFNTNFIKYCTLEKVMKNNNLIDMNVFLKQNNLPQAYSILVAEISELLFSIILLKEEDPKLCNIKPAALGIVDKYGCREETEFLKHLRNSIAHKNCDFFDDGSAVFRDVNDNKKETFYIDLTSQQFEILREEFRNLIIREFYPKIVVSQPLTAFYMGNDCFLNDYAFCGNVNLETVTLANHLQHVPQWCFCNCIKLKHITLPMTATSIKKRAFSGCENLSILCFNMSKLMEIDDYAFADCVNIDSISIDVKTKLGRRVFSGWTSRQTINIYGAAARPKHWVNGWEHNCKATIKYVP